VTRWPALLRTFGRTSLHGLRASPVTTAVAVTTIGVSLLLVGAFALLVANMERLLDRFGEDIRVSAYLEEGLSTEDQRRLLARVGRAPGVDSVELVTKQAALERFQAGGSARAALLEGLEDNPLPASLEISLVPGQRTAEGLERLAGSLEGVSGIAELGYGHEWIEGYARAVDLIQGVGFAIGGVLTLATVLIVANTIRLAIVARRDEISILRLVGGGRTFVAVPFLIEGLLAGLAGGLLALVSLYLLFLLLAPGLRGGLELLLGAVPPAFLSGTASLWLVLSGALLGVLGSGAALLQGRWDD